MAVPFQNYLTAKTDRFLVGSKESMMTPQGGLGRCRGMPGESGDPPVTMGELSRGCRGCTPDMQELWGMQTLRPPAPPVKAEAEAEAEAEGRLRLRLKQAEAEAEAG